MEFLSRSWSASALQVCKALASPTPGLIHKSNRTNTINNNNNVIPENNPGGGGGGFEEEESAKLSGNTFSFASSATSQLVLERIMTQSVSTQNTAICCWLIKRHILDYDYFCIDLKAFSVVVLFS